MSDFECYCNDDDDNPFETAIGSYSEEEELSCQCSPQATPRTSRVGTPNPPRRALQRPSFRCAPRKLEFEDDGYPQDYSQDSRSREQRLMKKTVHTTTTTEQQYFSPDEEEDEDEFGPGVVECPAMSGGGMFGDDVAEGRGRRVPKSRSILSRERAGLSPVRPDQELSTDQKFPWMEKRKKSPKKKVPVMRVGDDAQPRCSRRHDINRTMVYPPPASERTYDIYPPVNLETGRLKNDPLEYWADVSPIRGTGAEVLAARDPANRTCACLGREVAPRGRQHHVPHPGGKGRPSAVSSPKQICRRSMWNRSDDTPPGFLDY